MYGQTHRFDYSLDDHLILESIQKIDDRANVFDQIFTSRYNKSEYRPITISSFYIEKLLFGKLTASHSHLINVLLYILILIPIYFLIKEVMRYSKYSNHFVLWATLFLFTLHPIHTNVVSNIKCRDNLLSILFLVIACLALLKFLKKGLQLKWIVIYFISFAFALMSKLDAIGLIILAPIIIVLFSNETFNLKKINLYKLSISYLIPLIVILGGRKFVSTNAPIIEQEGISKSIVRFTENPLVSNWDILHRIEGLFSSFILYFKMLVVPNNYFFYFGYNTIKFPSNIFIQVIALLILSSLLFLFIYFFRRNKLVSFGILFLVTNLLYCVNFATPVAGIVAARYAFIASVGFCLLLALAIDSIPTKNIKLATLIGILLVYSYFSYARIGDWKNLETLISADLPHLENSHEAQRIAANVYLEIADSTIFEEKKLSYLNKAVDAFDKANKVYNENYITHIQKGIALFKLNEIDKSISSLLKGIELDTSFNAISHEILGDAYFLNSNFEKALSTYQKIELKQPNNQDIIQKVSSSLYEIGDINKTISYNDSIILKNPRFYAPYENLAYLYWLDGDTTKSLINLDKAIENSINETHKTEIYNSFQSFMREN